MSDATEQEKSEREAAYTERLTTRRAINGTQRIDFDKVNGTTEFIIEGDHNIRVFVDPENEVVEVGPESDTRLGI